MCIFSCWDNHRLWSFLFLWIRKAQTNTAAPAVLMRVRKTLNFTQLFLCCNTSKRQAVNQHITRFPYQFQKTVIHLSLSSLPCSPLTLQLYYSTSKWGLRFHMAQYSEVDMQSQRSQCHSGGRAEWARLAHRKTSLRRLHFQKDAVCHYSEQERKKEEETMKNQQ